ncbi:hypothetical protein OS493_004484 [Desmophyllum pertusum]|uniref:Uncharacterized protein n=1 Tax=Desmophyllum pertusum TaxID=174260 RepID=A0A9W9ZG61_9CNID|nr:hypothetical protein OS493_004484 [Desmophyllum pertusum]
MVLWGDSKATENSRTIADVIMSCFKIVIGFYQVVYWHFLGIVGTFGVAYTFLRPIKNKFEDRLQTFVLWVIFFDVCLGVMNTNCDVSASHKGNYSIAVNILFVLLNSSVLLVALGKGFLQMKFFWKKISSCLMQCFHFCCRGVMYLKRKLGSFLHSLTFTTQTIQFERQPLIQESN